MLRARHFLWLVALPVLGSASPAGEPVPKVIFNVSIRGDSGSARQFTVSSEKLYALSRRGSDFREVRSAPDTVQFAGVGTAELVSADSGKSLVLDVWTVGEEVSDVMRFTGRAFRIEHSWPTNQFVVIPR